MLKLEHFNSADFDRFISWIDSEELLIQIAGTYFKYPVTSDQLEKYVQDKTSMSFNVIDESTNAVIGHAEIILQDRKTLKFDKILIGDKSNRGKGIGRQL